MRVLSLTISPNGSAPADHFERILDPESSRQVNHDNTNIPDAKPSGGVLGRPVAIQYESFGLLTKLPRPIEEIDLNSPEITDHARQAHITLQISVNSSGIVERVKIVSVSGRKEGEEWIARIVARFSQSRFEPGEFDGKPVSTEFPVTVVVE